MTRKHPVFTIFAAAMLACAAPAFAADTPEQLAKIFKNVPKLNPKMALATTRVHYIPIPFVPISPDQMPNPQGPAPAYGIAATVAMQNTPATAVQTNTGLPAGGGVGAPTATPTCTGSAPAPYYGLTNGACVEQTYVCSTSGQWAFGPQYSVASSYCGGTTTAATTSPTTTTNTTGNGTTPTCSTTPSPCPSGDVQSSPPSCGTNGWVYSCVAPTFANTASAPAGTATSCNAGYTLTNGYCVANNAYVQNNTPKISIGYVALDMTNAVFNSTLPGGQQWSGTIGFMYGGGAGSHEVQIPASLFTGNPGFSLNGLPEVLNSYTSMSGNFTIYVVGGTSIPLTTNTNSAPTCPIVNGSADCAAGEIPGGTGVGRPVLNGIMLYIPVLGNLEIPIYGEVENAATSGYLYGGGTSYESTLFSLGISNTQYNLVNVIDTGSTNQTVNLGNGQTMTMAQACTVNGVFQGGQGVTYALGTPGETSASGLGNPTFVGGNGCNAVSNPGAGILPGPNGTAGNLQVTNIYDALYISVLSALDGGGTPNSTQIANATSITNASGAGDQPTNGGAGGAL